MVGDVGSILGAGTGAVVLALEDARRLVASWQQSVGVQGAGQAAAAASAAGAGGTAARDKSAGSGNSKRVAAGLEAAARKLWFFECWAHEVRGGLGLQACLLTLTLCHSFGCMVVRLYSTKCLPCLGGCAGFGWGAGAVRAPGGLGHTRVAGTFGGTGQLSNRKY